MKLLLSALAALCVAGCVGAPSKAAHTGPAAGTLLHYVRSNPDGSEAEDIRVYRRDERHVAVMKSRERCTSAALVTATIDAATGQATQLVAGRLGRDGRQVPIGVLDYDARARRIEATLDLPDRRLHGRIDVPDLPWHLYDFDLASLTVAPPAAALAGRDFSFGLALVWLEDGDEGFLRYLGRADAIFQRDEVRDGRPARRYEIGGSAFDGRGGPLWLDANDGQILAAEWQMPNHAGYTGFKLVLVRHERADDVRWNALLASHYDGCPL